MHRTSALAAAICFASTLSIATAAPNFVDTIERPLRYQPQGTDFVSIDGSETFNRPLYGSGTPFRVDAGDKPEFSLFLPGRGGVLRLGVRRGDRAIWLIDAATIESRYRPGSMLYTIRDPILGNTELHLAVMACFVDEAMLVKVERRGSSSAPDEVELVAAFGGATGERGARNGDIGTERIPMREFFQLKPEHCKDNRIDIEDGRFTLSSKPATLIGRSQPALQWTVGDASHWASPGELLTSAAGEAPVAVGRAPLRSDSSIHLRIDRRSHPSTQPGAAPPPPPVLDSDFAADMARSESLRQEIATRVVVDTPDAYLNAAVAALNIAAEGTWDSKEQAVMHGAVAWRNKLLGWRGGYWPDALGQHDRLRQHLNNWLPRQNDDPIAPQIPPPEAEGHLARNEDALHSNGNLTSNHYDMNLVAIDALFRHLLWTGDVNYAKQVWPTIQRHLAWERRLFRRPFGKDGQPLYEGYACIWASDDLWYNGGGTTHASAYNAFHNRMAARVAKWIGEDPAPYAAEADAIEQAMRAHLWIETSGHYAEWKDLLGEQHVHPDAAAWSVYHVIDSQIARPAEAWQLGHYAATALPRLPIKGNHVPDGSFQIATSDWFPYQWSTNNVVMAESAHTALALFQAARHDDALSLLRGAVLDSMYLGQCPGNVGMCTPLDMARGETQRDFADGCGALARTIVEGLFGIQPDAIAGKLTLTPRFPRDWKRASIRHASIDYSFEKIDSTDVYTLHSRVPHTREITVRVPARTDTLPLARADGQPVEVKIIPESVGLPMVEFTIEAADRPQKIELEWKGAAITEWRRSIVAARGRAMKLKFEVDEIVSLDDPQRVISEWSTSRDGFFTGIPLGTPGRHLFFADVKRGDMRWALPIELDLRETMQLLAEADQPPSELRITLRNNTRERFEKETRVLIDNDSIELRLALAPGESKTFSFPARSPGTYPIRIQAGDETVAQGSVTNWHVPLATDAQVEMLDLTTTFNDRVTQIFRNEYRSPRSPYCSLAVPKQGIGSWCKPTKQFEIDDAGLRAAAAKNDGRITLPNGVSFITPSPEDAQNVAFVSQWDIYPKSIDVPLNGHASRAYLLMAGSTQSMQSRFENGEVTITYRDGTTARLPLINPTTWWPIDQDYAIDDFAFRFDAAVPPRIDLKTGIARIPTRDSSRGKGRTIEGGAATVLDVPLDPTRELKSLTVRAIANEVVIGLMGVTLDRSEAD